MTVGPPVRVLTSMVADLFHPGHVRLLRAAAALGDHLTVAVLADARAASYKRQPVLSYEERAEVVAACRYVDAVIPLDRNITDAFMEEGGYHIRAYAVASDAEEARNFRTLWRDMDRSYFRRLPYTEGVSTSEIIDRILARDDLRAPALKLR